MSGIHSELRKVTSELSVLYVEDEDNTREQFENIFKLLFSEVNSAQNGELALIKYNQRKYDLVITDLTMPQMDGMSMIAEILKINPKQHIVIMTAHNTSKNFRDSIGSQVDGILLKPVSMEKLFQMLYEVCHPIYTKNKELNSDAQGRKLHEMLANDENALFVVVVDKLKDIINQFGIRTKDAVLCAVKEHLLNFGIEKSSEIEAHCDVLLCAIEKKYLNNVLESLQDFNDFGNTLLVKMDELKIYITLSYGIVMLSKRTSNINYGKGLLNHIDSIINEIKDDDNSTSIIKMDIDIEEAKRNDSINRLGFTLEALKQNTIIPFYQPIVDINTMQRVSYQVLARIKDGEKLVLPKFFIDLSEKAGILEDISEIVFKQSFYRFKDNDFSFHLHLIESQWKRGCIEDYLLYLSNNYKVDRSRVIIDILNNEMLNISSKKIKSILKLKELGFKIALKGFATGNINLELFSILKPEYVKIDQILLQKSLSDEVMKKILSLLLSYANSIGIKSIIMGVENETILHEAKKLGFNYAQGYFIGKPSEIIENTLV